MSRVRLIFIATVVLLATVAQAESVIQGDLLIDGHLGVGTRPSSARLEVHGDRRGPSFLVSGVDMTPFLLVSTGGLVGMGRIPRSPLDIASSGDSTAVFLRQAGGAPQLALSTDEGTSHWHSVSANFKENATAELSFTVWGAQASGAPLMSLQSESDGVTRMHIRPAGIARADLEVSDGARTGGGRLHRRREVSPADEALMSGASSLSRADEVKAAHALRAMRYAAGVRTPSLVYDSAPTSVQRSDGFVSVDARVTNAELAMKELSHRIAQLRAAMEKGGGSE